jgi:hypothetical protein
MWTYLGRVIKQGRAWTDAEGTQHPAQWNRWTDEEKAAKGLVWDESLQPVPFDNRFYWSAGVPKALDDVNAVDEDGNPVLDEDGVQVVTKGLKSNAIQVVKQQAAGKLALSDWKVVKAAEVADYSVDQETLTYRAAVRAASNTIEAAITAAADLDAFKALYETPVDENGVPTDNAPINDWPEEI